MGTAGCILFREDGELAEEGEESEEVDEADEDEDGLITRLPLPFDPAI